MVELKQHYVAFLDVLGFKEMVHSDMLGDNHLFLSKLFKCHQSAAQIFSDDPNCSITQFSDSIVVSKPYDAKSFTWFATRVAQYQRLLLDEELLCRGGIAVNKHFSNGSFTFSAGLIAAYGVESQTARYPRVVISPEVMDLVFPERKMLPNFLIEEDDGLLFIDYIGLTSSIRPGKLAVSINNIVGKLLDSSVPSVREKGLWLAAYSDAVLGSSLSLTKFSGKKIRTR
ncbi:hypothetical protein [Collimonas silvisoli]|uniref:hypothetical protein n=1 Tax=Collimonas silvisoli TaxID=2825884 RepID=UPI001B8BA015|nr:hypothetical protein [Collimonas silvisoli]